MLFAKLPEYPNYRIYINGDVFSERKNREMLLKHNIDAKGYAYVALYDKDKKRRAFKVHRLLAMCFLPCNADFKNVSVDHININRADNSLTNLRYASPSLQSINQKYKPTNTGYPFIHKCKNHSTKTGYIFNCKITRNRKDIINNNRAKLEDAIALVRETIINNRFILDGMPNETLSIIKEKYNINID